MGGSEALNGVLFASKVPLGIFEILTSVLFSVARIEKKFNNPDILELFNMAPALKRLPKALIPFDTIPPA